MGTKFVPPVIALGLLVIGKKIVVSMEKPVSVLFAEEE